MASDTLATFQGTAVRPFRVLIGGITVGPGLAEIVSAHFEHVIEKIRVGSVITRVLPDQTSDLLLRDVEIESFDLLIVCNVMTIGDGNGGRIEPNELLAELYERTHKPIVAMSGHGELNEELRATCGFAVMDMPFTGKQVEQVCQKLLGQNGYLLK